MTKIKQRQFKLRLRRQDTGEESDHTIFAMTEAEARDRAPEVARRALDTMADRQYAQFEVLSCNVPCR